MIYIYSDLLYLYSLVIFHLLFPYPSFMSSPWKIYCPYLSSFLGFISSSLKLIYFYIRFRFYPFPFFFTFSTLYLTSNLFKSLDIWANGKYNKDPSDIWFLSRISWSYERTFKISIPWSETIYRVDKLINNNVKIIV